MRPKVLAIVHAETSTGAMQPMEEVGKLCHEFDTLLDRRCRHVARLRAVEARRMGASMRSTVARRKGLELSAGPVAGDVQPARGGGDRTRKTRCRAGTST